MPRTAAFDRDTVLDRATDVFWEQGYARTSVGDLVGATGLQPGSLYAAFGNKKGLFLEVIDHYNEALIAQLRTLRGTNGRALDKLRDLLRQVVDEAAAGGDGRGCLNVSALLELSRHDADVADRLCGYNAELRKCFAWLVKDAQAEGDVPATVDAHELAAFVMNNIWGLRVMCTSRPDRASLEAIVSGVLAALRSPAD